MKHQKWKWIAVGLCIAVILILTFQSQAGISSLSFAFRKFLLKLFGLSWNEGKKYWWYESAHLRKIAHTIEYFVFGGGGPYSTSKEKMVLVRRNMFLDFIRGSDDEILLTYKRV